MRKSEPPPPRHRARPGRASGAPSPGVGARVNLGPGYLFAVFTLVAASVVAFRAQGSRPEHVIFVSLIVAAAGLVGYAVHRTLGPLAALDEGMAPEVIGGRTRAALEREKALTLRAIKDLEFDRAMRKVSEHDWAEMTGVLRARAVRIMHDLDRREGFPRSAIDRDLNARRLAAGLPVVTLEQAGLAAAPSGLAADSPVTSSRCRTCGTGNDEDARFCKSCGARLGSPA